MNNLNLNQDQGLIIDVLEGTDNSNKKDNLNQSRKLEVSESTDNSKKKEVLVKCEPIEFENDEDYNSSDYLKDFNTYGFDKMDFSSNIMKPEVIESLLIKDIHNDNKKSEVFQSEMEIVFTKTKDKFVSNPLDAIGQIKESVKTQRTSSVGIRGKILTSQAREIIANVIAFMEKEGKEGIQIPLTRFKERVLAATKIGEYSYRQVKKEAKQVLMGEKMKFTCPKKNVNRPNPKSDLRQEELEQLRAIIHECYILQKKRPTLNGIQQMMVERGIKFKGALSTLSKIVRKLGFSWRETIEKKKFLVESYEIRYKRIQYLELFQQYLQEKRPIIYADETYINSCSQKKNDDKSPKKPNGKDRRLTILHAGGANGFINNALLMYQADNSIPDYSNELTHTTFMQWVKNQLLPNLPERSVVVINNKNYSNVTVGLDPTPVSTKHEMITWLSTRSIIHHQNSKKPVLYHTIKENKNKFKQYVFDSELARHGHAVLRLPPNHPDLNPLEKIWRIVKDYVGSKHSSRNIMDITRIAQEKFDMITSEDWANLCRNANAVVEGYMRKEALFDIITDELTFTPITDSDDDEWDEDSDVDEPTNFNSQVEYPEVPQNLAYDYSYPSPSTMLQNVIFSGLHPSHNFP